MNIIEVHHKRTRQERDGEYLYEALYKIVWKNTEEGSGPVVVGPVVSSRRDIVQRVHELLQQPGMEDARLLFYWLDNPHTPPFEFGPGTLSALRTDPDKAYRMIVQDPTPEDRASGKTVIDKVGRYVYIQVRSGSLKDPCTGQTTNLAYGQNHGWRIKGIEGNADAWLKVVELVDDAEPGSEPLVRFASTRWVMIDLMELLARPNPAFYFENKEASWGVSEPWIRREELKYLYAKSQENLS